MPVPDSVPSHVRPEQNLWKRIEELTVNWATRKAPNSVEVYNHERDGCLICGGSNGGSRTIAGLDDSAASWRDYAMILWHVRRRRIDDVSLSQI